MKSDTVIIDRAEVITRRDVMFDNGKASVLGYVICHVLGKVKPKRRWGFLGHPSTFPPVYRPKRGTEIRDKLLKAKVIEQTQYGEFRIVERSGLWNTHRMASQAANRDYFELRAHQLCGIVGLKCEFVNEYPQGTWE